VCERDGEQGDALLLSGACDSLAWRAIESVSFARSDFKLRMCAQLVLARMGIFSGRKLTIFK
jgi:hypothetical protein